MFKLALLFMLGSLVVSSIARAEITLPHVFSDHMVLQREAPLPVWGQAAAGEKVRVSLGKDTVSATADGQGQWKVILPPRPAGGPYTLTVAGSKTLTVNDVLVGEVWFASGQSNMQFALQYAKNSEEEIAQATSSTIRFFTAPRTMNLDPQTDVNSRWVVCSPQRAEEFSAVAYFFAKELQRRLGVPVGILQAAYAGTAIAAFMDRATLESKPEWAPLLEVAERSRTEPKLLMAEGCPYVATCTYNTMIHPLLPYRFRGVLWYQGEADVRHAYSYRELFPGLINGWRRVAKHGDFPFLFVQLANYEDELPKTALGQSLWAELREAQTVALSVKNTGMATAIDLGDKNDVHPTNKQDVGKRLALAAGHVIYGWKDEYSGPVYISNRKVGSAFELSFSHVGKGLVTKGDRLEGFVIAGEDRRFVPAEAVIRGDKVIVSSLEVPAPAAVRYAWANSPVVTLYNVEGLPAPPFRTDAWSGLTDGK